MRRGAGRSLCARQFLCRRDNRHPHSLASEVADFEQLVSPHDGVKLGAIAKLFDGGSGGAHKEKALTQIGPSHVSRGLDDATGEARHPVRI